MDINKFYEALEKNEVEDFLLGIGTYFYKGNEFTNGEENHDSTATWMDILNFIKNNPEKGPEVFFLLDKSIINILHTHMDAAILEDCVMCIWRYLLCKIEKNIFQSDWKFTPELLKIIKDRYNYYLIHKTGNSDLDKRLLVNVELFKSRFDFDIC